MIATLLSLEDFSDPQNTSHEVQPNAENKHAQREAFDEGYRDGWNDAVKEARSEESAVQNNIATALQELGFTYFEARQHIMGSFKPLLETMLKSVLPHASSASLVEFVQEELKNLAELVEPPIRILCAPENHDQLSALVATNGSTPIEVHAEETLAGSQIKLCYADGFTALDADAAIKRIEIAIADFFAPPQPERLMHG